ncbi:zinc finger protein 841-like [Periplaneta americana]|uniref:zinc finger protein 841-like n=1 Tax=Periplaneta americana TaxID=6978 RepID=UPI0037E72D84
MISSRGSLMYNFVYADSVVMDVIKMEPEEVDPLALKGSNYTDVEERNVQGIHMTGIKVQCIDESSERTSAIKPEETLLTVFPSRVKFEAEEESSELDIAKEELKLELAKNDEVFAESTGIVEGEVSSRWYSFPQEEDTSVRRSAAHGEQPASEATADRHLSTRRDESVRNNAKKCNICGKFLSATYSLIRHIRTHTGEKPFKCDVCGKCFSSMDVLRKHLRIHTGEKPFSCKICNKSFSTSSLLKNHTRTHTGEKPFKCDVCGKCVSTSHSLKGHQRQHTGEKLFKCEVCGKRLTRLRSLKMHIRQHTGEKPFKCDDCGKAFSESRFLKTHAVVHSGDTPFECDVCKMFFPNSSSLKTHARQHTGEKPFKCNNCGKCFSLSGSLSVHMRCHTGEKPFKCSDCGKGFSRSSHLLIHARQHTGEKPFKCDHCGKCFASLNSLKTHIRVHTGEKPYKCHICGKGFSVCYRLKNHLRLQTDKEARYCAPSTNHWPIYFNGDEVIFLHIEWNCGLINSAFLCLDFSGLLFLCLEPDCRVDNAGRCRAWWNGNHVNSPTASLLRDAMDFFVYNITLERFLPRVLARMALECACLREALSTDIAPERLFACVQACTSHLKGFLPLSNFFPSLRIKTSCCEQTEILDASCKVTCGHLLACSARDSRIRSNSDVCKDTTANNANVATELQDSHHFTTKGLLGRCEGVRQPMKGQGKRRVGTGPRNVTSAWDDRHLVRMAVTNRTAPSSVESMLEYCNGCGSICVNGSSPSFEGWTSGSHAVAFASIVHQRLRLQWARERRHWRAEWQNVVFTDESHFNLSCNDGCIRVKRYSGERNLRACVVERHSGQTSSVMVWGAIGYNMRSFLLRIQNNLNSNCYIRKFLEPGVLPLLQETPHAIFQQDNTRPHVFDFYSQHVGCFAKNLTSDQYQIEQRSLLPYHLHYCANNYILAVVMDTNWILLLVPPSTPIVMDVIKTEPEADPLAIEASDNIDWEEKKPSFEAVDELTPQSTEMKTEDYGLTSEIIIEETPAPVTDPMGKCEAEGGACDVDSMEEELKTKPFKCDVCEKRFSQSSNLKYHGRLHAREKPYKCDVCEEYFTRSSSLKIHARRHTGEKPYTCNVCEKSFSHFSNLKTHARLHTGEKPYKCEVCGKCFSQSSHVKLHARLHTGEKLYKCEVCEKCFTQPGSVKSHARLHTGEKPFKCDVCEKCFSQAANLKIHARCHTGEKPFKCGVCGKYFRASGQLRRHVSVHI